MTEDSVAAVVDAMTLDPFMDDVILMGTTQQDMRMEHYARVALAALQSRPAGQFAESAADLVYQWRTEWGGCNGSHWGDRTSWDTAQDIARRIDEHMAAAIAKTRQRIEDAVGNADPVKASLRPAEPAGEEPVAWMYKTHLGQPLTTTFRRTHYDGFPVTDETPLYARPAPSNPDRLVDWRSHCEWLLDLDEIHVGEGETDVLERIASIRAALSAPALDGEVQS